MAVRTAPRRQRRVDYSDYSHVGPGTPAGEYLRTFWHPVFRSQDLLAGKAVPLRVLGQDFTLYRGETGEPHVLAARCAHRATLLSTGWVEGDSIRCFYHGWVYDQTGQCVEQPAEDARFARKVKIPSYPAQDYLGLIFAYLGEDDPPPLPRFPFMEDIDESECVRMTHRFLKGFSYRNGLENSVDPVHVAFVHRNSEYAGLVGAPKVVAEETDYGMVLRSIRPGGSVRVTQFQMPTILYIKQGPRDPAEAAWRDFLLWRLPIDDEHQAEMSVTKIYLRPEQRNRFLYREEDLITRDRVPELAMEVMAGNKIHVDEVTDFNMAVNVQDYVAQFGQGVIYEREFEKLGRSDVGVILLRKLYEREMHNLAQGLPLKNWSGFTPKATTGLPGG